jgi:hypothetical protein
VTNKRLILNWLVSTGIPAGMEWICIPEEAPDFEVGGRDWNRNTITQFSQRELSVSELPDYAEEIVECWAGLDGWSEEDLSDLANWIGDGGEAVVEKLKKLFV